MRKEWRRRTREIELAEPEIPEYPPIEYDDDYLDYYHTNQRYSMLESLTDQFKKLQETASSPPITWRNKPLQKLRLKLCEWKQHLHTFFTIDWSMMVP